MARAGTDTEVLATSNTGEKPGEHTTGALQNGAYELVPDATALHPEGDIVSMAL